MAAILSRPQCVKQASSLCNVEMIHLLLGYNRYWNEDQFDGLTNALELLQSCAKSLILCAPSKNIIQSVWYAFISQSDMIDDTDYHIWWHEAVFVGTQLQMICR